MTLDSSRPSSCGPARTSRATAVLCLALLLAATATRAAPLRIGVGERVAAAPLHVAASRGYFEDEGLEVALSVERDGRELVEGLAEEELDLAVLSADQLLLANGTGLELRGVYVLGVSGTADALVANAEVSDTRRLAGRRVAVMPDSAGELLLRWALQRKGRRLTDVTLVPLGGPEAVRALLDGEVDAAALHGTDLAPFADDAFTDDDTGADSDVASGFRTLATAADAPGLVSDLLVGAEGSLDAGKTATMGVVRAIDRASGWMRRHPDETLALLVGMTSSTGPAPTGEPDTATTAAPAAGSAGSDGPSDPDTASTIAAWSRALGGTTLLDVEENMALLRGEFQKAFSSMSEVLDTANDDRAREVPSANRYLALSALRQVAARR